MMALETLSRMALETCHDGTGDPVMMALETLSCMALKTLSCMALETLSRMALETLS